MTEEDNKKPKLTLKLPGGSLKRDLLSEYISLGNKGTSSVKGVLVEMRHESGAVHRSDSRDEERLTQNEKVRRVGALHQSWRFEQEIKDEEATKASPLNDVPAKSDLAKAPTEEGGASEGANLKAETFPQTKFLESDLVQDPKIGLDSVALKSSQFGSKASMESAVTSKPKATDDDRFKKRFGSSSPQGQEGSQFKHRTKSKLNKFSDYSSVDPALALVGEDKLADFAPKPRTSYKRPNRFAKKNYSHKVNMNVIVDEKFISLRKLSEKLSLSQEKLAKFLSGSSGKKFGYDEIISRDLIELIGVEFGYNITFKDKVLYEEFDDAEGDLQERPPVVTIMGHVDHGKTTLLDKIRSSRIVESESGGITQHIGAYQIVTRSGKKITFIDTPGHEAFTAMRMRGAMVTDIIVLVVAADDGVNAQTVEAINHALAASASGSVSMIVAVNKIDKYDADVNKTLTSLLQYNVIVEELGGDILHVPISAKEGTNLDKLEDAILLQAEMLDVRANFNRPAQGTVLEVSIDKRRGLLVTLIVQKGTLNVGDIVVCGNHHSRIRSMEDSEGKQIKSATPSTPVIVMGFSMPAESGESFIVVESEKLARSIIAERESIQFRKSSAPAEAINIFEDSDKKYLNIIIKADVAGSLEAIFDSIIKLSNDQIKIKVIHKGIGLVTQSDLVLAEASSAMIFAFRVKSDVDPNSKIKIFTYSVIYDLIHDIKESIMNMMKPTISEEVIGVAEVKKIFDIDKLGKVAGCYVKKGTIKIGNPVKLIRDSRLIYETSLEIIRHYKNVVKEVKVGMECGLFLNNYSDVQLGDIIESVEKTESRARLQ